MNGKTDAISARDNAHAGSGGDSAGPMFVINPIDNVAVALRAVSAGEKLCVPVLSGAACGTSDGEVVAREDVPAGHKIARVRIKKGSTVVKYGCAIGAATRDIEPGERVHTHNLATLLSEKVAYTRDETTAKAFAAEHAQSARDAPAIEAYVRPTGEIGIRNEIWIVPTVGCVNRTAIALAQLADAKYGKAGKRLVDGVYAWTHPYGCSQMGDDHATTRKILADLARHPNAGAVLVVALGCENNTVEAFKDEIGAYDGERVKFLVTQDSPDEMAEGAEILERLAEYASKARRETVSAARLVIGMKCGGSDGFSGITANALVGRVCDRVTAFGGSAILTEVPEMFGAEQLLMDRCETRELFDKTVSLIENFKRYYVDHNQVVYENPSPGNKAGGITTLEDKSCGCVQKGGKAPVRGVLAYGERVATSGLQLLEGPGNDIVSTTAMTASGAHLILFTTGRGTPLGAPVPTVKISSNTALAERKPGWIDFDAGRVLIGGEGDGTLDDLMTLILDVASGRKGTKNEINGYREIAIFKDGVTL
jgi:altronate hydrolase